jgi:hypothetical protein
MAFALGRHRCRKPEKAAIAIPPVSSTARHFDRFLNTQLGCAPPLICQAFISHNDEFRFIFTGTAAIDRFGIHFTEILNDPKIVRATLAAALVRLVPSISRCNYAGGVPGIWLASSKGAPRMTNLI